MNNIQTISDLMRYCHMPQKFVVDIRRMKNGDIFFIGRYKDNNLCVRASISKMLEKRYAFNGAYTNLTTNKFVLCWVFFELHENNIKFDVDNTNEIKTFALICRYIALSINNVPNEQKNIYFKTGLPVFLNGVLINKNDIIRDHFNHKQNQNHKQKRYVRTFSLEIILDDVLDKLINLDNKKG